MRNPCAETSSVTVFILLFHLSLTTRRPQQHPPNFSITAVLVNLPVPALTILPSSMGFEMFYRCVVTDNTINNNGHLRNTHFVSSYIITQKRGLGNKFSRGTFCPFCQDNKLPKVFGGWASFCCFGIILTVEWSRRGLRDHSGVISVDSPSF